MVVALLVTTALAFALGLVGCDRRRLRPWVCHAVMGLAMAAMLVPERDPLGPAAWALVLGGVLLWTAFGALRERWVGTAAGPAAYTSAREVVELGLMTVLVLVMPALHGHAAPASGHHGSSAPDVRGLVLALLAAWLATAVVLHPRTHREPAALGASVLMVAAMAAMAVAC
jgi:hypothetical protein